MHVTTEMVAEFYGVDREAVASLVKRNRDEFEDDGYTVVIRSAFEERFKMNLSSQSARVALFPRRAVLRVGMLPRFGVRCRPYVLYCVCEQIAG
ncbi:hypothetical protein [Prescottella agglutinans]|uniref:KilA-N DNA-binding domain-containing protein n=1 Tax=Prescottella agglutinans TaxID=1644129 RepID=A0ABT6MFR7_9NOCA|nr:hypothetical protein [Prescottella agglutinans]MDH6283117.1 hypothetical protein [Prescottella agglutinans]